ncbi:MAG: TauD/TfdA family dioxygenase [Campylobacter sp.]|nr:TauD/TfdA family dioxygenase [Campylobacter sp.]
MKDFIELNFLNSDMKFDYKMYENCKNWGGEQEYMLKFILKQPFADIIFNFIFSDTKILLFKNCPIDIKIPQSPIDNGYLTPRYYPIARDFMLMMYKALNVIPYAYKDENNGKIFRSVVPLKNQGKMIGSYGAKIAFNFHSDNPTYKIYPEYENKSLNSPEFLSLYCMRGDKNANTDLIILDDILGNLDNETIQNLQKNDFIVNTPNSFDKYHEVENVSVIAKKDNKFYTRFDYHNIHAQSENSEVALQNFKNAIEKTKQISHNFQQGDFLIFKNQEILHSRNSFTPKFDGKDRWLIRIYGATNMKFLNHNEIKFGEKYGIYR